MNWSSLWNLLQGRKTYLLALTCMAAVLARTASDALSGAPVDWERLMHELFGCLMAMSLRHGIATSQKNDGGVCPLSNSCRPGPQPDVTTYRNFDR